MESIFYGRIRPNIFVQPDGGVETVLEARFMNNCMPLCMKK